jgi:hypothetical protein
MISSFLILEKYLILSQCPKAYGHDFATVNALLPGNEKAPEPFPAKG